ncbi:Crp/Fnr family transcriptional regulator [Amycolatopsis sp. QT-25]|uniref:Crp/Fnr family transcriptional regulator n=1 Tax=Amycolatopsis sp. QT-25 TaxID=3034022 RepID=UPI0023EB5D39|nr:Crp/Fnr family transcriptional regulator [Amycolatopsis sp. QT-25]WET77300.1 Crp/Fnr family transcriptional regulator [Amycolatopsis sp. QT-25]
MTVRAPLPPDRGLCAAVNPGTAAGLLRIGTGRLFRSGDVLVREGESTTFVVLLLEGCAKVTATTADGGRALLAIRGAGDLIGELAGFDGEPRSATVTAVGRLRARVAPRAEFHRFLAEHPDAAVAVSRLMAAKLRWSTERRVDFSGYDVAVRLARVLVALVATHGTHTARGWEIGFPLTQPELAALIGAAEPTVHKSLTELRRREILDTGYRRMTIVDLPALRAAAVLPA